VSDFAQRASRTTASVPLALVLAGFLFVGVSGFTDGIVPLLVAASLLVAAGLSFVPAGRVDWQLLLAGLVLVILFIPIRRFTFPAALPFELEPYRVVVALILIGWFASLLVDSRVRVRRTILDGPMALVTLALATSIAVNPSRVAASDAALLKSVTFFASFLLIFYFVVSVVRDRSRVESLVKLLVLGGAVVSVLAIIEYWNGYNAYDDLMGRIAFLEFHSHEPGISRTVRRAFGPAEHPIALGALLAMLVPLSLYVAKTVGGKRWWGVLLILVLGMLTTVSRTGVTMIVAAGLVLLCLRPREGIRLIPLVLVVLVLAQVAVPGSLGTLRYYFNPPEGLVAQQKSSEGSCDSAGRVADLGPAFSEFGQKPLFGYGYGTRILRADGGTACILDNQWLGTLLDAGLAGVAGFLWLFGRFVRRLGREARRDRSPAGWLPAALASSVVAYAVGMLTFDAFSFIQVTFVTFILLALGSSLVAARGDETAAAPRAATVL
jgi:polysaccharide biosynthesis protein PslJ